MRIETCDIKIPDTKPTGCSKIGTCDMGSCTKLTTFDWLHDIPLAAGEELFPYVEIRFKNSRKAFFHRNGLELNVGDVVAVEAASGHDIGVVSMRGQLVRLQMKKKKVDPEQKEILKVYRYATQRDIDKWQALRLKEEEVKYKAREYVIKHGLQLKISDVEYQGDGSKVTFYYTAESRVDFRQLIKDLAREFSTRIEMRQIGYRQEAARLGGLGSCGRELCCSTWLTDFRSVSTSAAKYQQLSLNMQKLAGQCGKLKCCLNFELDSYLDALTEFPAQNRQLMTEKGNARLIKTDIFKGLLWYAYTNPEENGNTWHKLSLEQVNEIIDLNDNDQKAGSLEEYSGELALQELTPADDFENVVGQDNINRFDEVKPRKKRRKKRRSNQKRKNGNAGAQKNSQNKRKNNHHKKNKPRNDNKGNHK